MQKIDNFDSVQAAEEIAWAKPTAGGYVCMILDAEDVPKDPITQKGDYLKMKFDFAEGELCSYYTDINDKFGNWPSAGTFIRSYKESAMRFFKAFITTVEQSNPGYKWNWDEKSLKGKYIGIVLGEEEYYDGNGNIKSRLKVDSVRSVKAIRENDFKVPAVKRVDAGSSDLKEERTFTSISTEDVPF